jgi:hypothetical protein
MYSPVARRLIAEVRTPTNLAQGASDDLASRLHNE